MAAWSDYQETCAEFFREVGLTATTNATVQGVRTAHTVDVLVEFSHLGHELSWIVECKLWKSRVSRLHVLGLRTIVEDCGADHGILLSESGFQSGAHEAATKSSVILSNLDSMRQLALDALFQQRLLKMPMRIARAHARYWAMGKSERIDRGLRPDTAGGGYSGHLILNACQEVLLSTLAGLFPPTGTGSYIYPSSAEITDISSALDWLDLALAELEDRLTVAEGKAGS